MAFDPHMFERPEKRAQLRKGFAQFAQWCNDRAATESGVTADELSQSSKAALALSRLFEMSNPTKAFAYSDEAKENMEIFISTVNAHVLSKPDGDPIRTNPGIRMLARRIDREFLACVADNNNCAKSVKLAVDFFKPIGRQLH